MSSFDIISRNYFAQYLDKVEAKRKEQEKLKEIVDFFGLDIKKQRQDKLKKISKNEQNEQDGII